ncbi:MAG: Maf family protein [Planctomycetes bacterium]|nr:Maf family protein [Planctomycetota bacterium]
MDLLLASTSPRRRDLLAAAGLRFELCEPGPEYVQGGDHDHGERGEPRELARQRARRKALGAPGSHRAPVLGVDTVVDLDGIELGKPRDREQAEEMLRALAGRRHLVHTAHCLRAPDGDLVGEQLATSTVSCRAPTQAELERYLDSGQWRGKAGGYGIQDDAQAFLTLVDGAFDTVVGLHVDAVRALLANWSSRESS